MECKMIYFARPIVGITEKQKEQIRMVEANMRKNYNDL